MKQTTRTALSLGLGIVMLLVAVLGSYGLSLWAINKSQHQWCDTLSLITANAHPTTENARVFYAKLHELERRFGC